MRVTQYWRDTRLRLIVEGRRKIAVRLGKTLWPEAQKRTYILYEVCAFSEGGILPTEPVRIMQRTSEEGFAKKENPVAFSLGEEGLTWLGKYDISIEDLLAGNTGTKKETKLEKTKKLILDLMSKRKVMCLEELEAELRAYRISARTERDTR